MPVRRPAAFGGFRDSSRGGGAVGPPKAPLEGTWPRTPIGLEESAHVGYGAFAGGVPSGYIPPPHARRGSRGDANSGGRAAGWARPVREKRRRRDCPAVRPVTRPAQEPAARRRRTGTAAGLRRPRTVGRAGMESTRKYEQASRRGIGRPSPHQQKPRPAEPSVPARQPRTSRHGRRPRCRQPRRPRPATGPTRDPSRPTPAEPATHARVTLPCDHATDPARD